MTLYEIDRTIMEVVNNGFAFDEETGEITFDTSNLESLQLERDTKVENIACWIKNLKADIDGLKEEEKALKERRTAKENKIENLEKYLMFALNGEKFETARVAISYRKSQVVEIADGVSLPEEYTRTKTTVEPDKTALKNALKGGAVIEGVELVEKNNIAIK